MIRWCSVPFLFLMLDCSPLVAREAPSSGEFHFYAGLSAMSMLHDAFDDDEAGVHLVAAGYKHVGRDWYLGIEVGEGTGTSLLGSDWNLTTLELNGKRVIPLADTRFRIGLVAGLSYNHATFYEQTLFGADDGIDIDDWVLGMQTRANLHVELGRVLVGFHVGYRLTADLEGAQEVEGLAKGWDYSNVAGGLHLGFLVR
jgi:hypothetical protein